MGPRPIVAGFRSKGQDRSQDRTGLDLRSGSQEKSCGVGLRGFESHPPHQEQTSGSPVRSESEVKGIVQSNQRPSFQDLISDLVLFPRAPGLGSDHE